MSEGEGKWQLDCIMKGRHIRKQNENGLIKTIEECKKRGVTVILTTPPVAKIYHNKFDKNIQLELRETFDFCIHLSTAYDNVYYLNEYSAEEFNDDDFMNPTHLNLSGATKLTRDINEIIEYYEVHSSKVNSIWHLQNRNR
jgi:hypothetical protein